MRTYAYLRTDCIMTDRITTYHSYLCSKGYDVQMNRVIVELVNADKSILYRDKFMGLINYALEQGNLLIVKGIDCLGQDYLEILNTIDIIDQKKIRLICLDYSLEELTGGIKITFLHILKLCRDFENMKIKKSENLNKINLHKKAGRPEKLSKKEIIEIIEKLKLGMSIYRLAKDYTVSATVIRRIMRNNMNFSVSLQ